MRKSDSRQSIGRSDHWPPRPRGERRRPRRATWTTRGTLRSSRGLRQNVNTVIFQIPLLNSYYFSSFEENLNVNPQVSYSCEDQKIELLCDFNFSIEQPDETVFLKFVIFVSFNFLFYKNSANLNIF